jgi:hypothetical protein
MSRSVWFWGVKDDSTVFAGDRGVGWWIQFNMKRSRCTIHDDGDVRCWMFSIYEDSIGRVKKSRPV